MVASFEQANAEMNRVNEGWHDDQNLRFMNEFRHATAAIHNISDMMQAYSAYIRRYAAALEAAKNIRI